jgi:hypothetical protein
MLTYGAPFTAQTEGDRFGDPALRHDLAVGQQGHRYRPQLRPDPHSPYRARHRNHGHLQEGLLRGRKTLDAGTRALWPRICSTA